MDLTDAEAWIRGHVALDGPPVVVHERPWSTVMRVPVRDGPPAWFKACALVQAFEPVLTSALSRRRPDVLPELIAEDAPRGWLLLGDAEFSRTRSRGFASAATSARRIAGHSTRTTR